MPDAKLEGWHVISIIVFTGCVVALASGKPDRWGSVVAMLAVGLVCILFDRWKGDD